MLLVGPPGTGKTLIARAVAGEAGVPFISITGSDFMEMFVGVGAARVRDLFQTARKQAPAIIFVDEIDSIGRKRGAGLGGGHDEREQTLNQMLAEMDGFEATEGIVMMAATNRPDILDPALLRPGRFDRQIIVPLPPRTSASTILKVHFRDKKIVRRRRRRRRRARHAGHERRRPREPRERSGAVRGAARRAGGAPRRLRRARATACSWASSASRSRSREEEKEIVAYHEGGHAVCAYVLEHADPLHKVTILPTGMALGVTQQLPVEERHIYKREYIADSLVVRLGGRVAEELVFGHQSTGAQNDLVGNTELARKMVREWGMSDRIGPMAWGAAGRGVPRRGPHAHARLLRRDRTRHRRRGRAHPPRRGGPLPQGARASTAPGSTRSPRRCSSARRSTATEVADLVDNAMGRKVGGPRKIIHADGTEEPATDVPRGRPIDPGTDARAQLRRVALRGARRARTRARGR